MKKIICFALAFMLTISATPYASAEQYTTEEQYEIFKYSIDFIKEYGLESGSEDDPLKNALLKLFEAEPDSFNRIMQYMLSSYDSHSMFLPAGTYDQAFPQTDSYVGVGITIAQTDNGVTITEVNPLSGAFKAGVKSGDILHSIEGKLVSTLDFSEVAPLLRGDEGTRVAVTVMRDGTAKNFSLKRTVIGEPNFSSSVIEDGIYYMDWNRFATTESYIQFVFSITEMLDKGCRSLILDVRDNPGGDLNMAVNLVNRLLPDAVEFFCIADRGADDKLVYDMMASDGIGPRLNQIVVLVNESSASASEVIMASIVDTGYGVAVGEQTYGKARGQYHTTFKDGSGISLTSLKLMGLLRNDYEGIGLEPDYFVSNYKVPHPAAECAPLREFGIAYGNCSDDAQRLNEALIALGYMQSAEKIYRFGVDTQTALNDLALDSGLGGGERLTPELARIINARIVQDAGQSVIFDAQMERALEIAREAAKAPAQYTVDDLGNFVNKP